MSKREAAARLRLALDLYGIGEAIFRQRLRRERPRATAAQIETRVAAWLRTRPGAEDGDADGVRGRWPRRRS
jgi:hypothetical protein